MAGEAIVDWSRILYLSTNGTEENIPCFKHARTAGTAAVATIVGRWTTLRRYDGFPSGPGATAPTTSVATSLTTPGAVPFTSPATGAKKRLVSITVSALVAGVIQFYDLLNENGNMSAVTPVTPTAHTTNLPTAPLTRHTSGVGVTPWLTIWSQIGTTARLIRLNSYTDDAGNTGQQGPNVAFGATNLREQDRTIPLALAPGDKGAREVASLLLSGTTGTAGNMGVSMKKIFCKIPVLASAGGASWNAIVKAGGPLDLGVNSDACLHADWQANTVTAPDINWDMLFIEQ